MGARPLSRLIQEKIKKPIAEQILYGKLSKGGNIKLDIKNNELTFEYLPFKKSANKKKINVKN